MRLFFLLCSEPKLKAKEDFERARELEPDPAIDKELKRRRVSNTN